MRCQCPGRRVDTCGMRPMICSDEARCVTVAVQDAVCSMLQTYADFELCSPRGAMLPGPSPREVARLVKKESDSYLEKVKLRKQKVRGEDVYRRR